MLISLKYYLVPKNTVPSSTLAPTVFTTSYPSPTSTFESVFSVHKPAKSPSQNISGSKGKWGGVGGKGVKKFFGHYTSHTTFFLHIFVNFSTF
jgi:hypothetical protein